MILLPLGGAIALALMPKIFDASGLSKWVALVLSLASSILGFVLIASMQAHTADLQFSESLNWVGSYSIRYDVGVDGMNALLILLISLLSPVLIASEWNRKFGGRGMNGLLLLLQFAFLGTVCAQDLFLLIFFWGVSVIPFYLLIGIWGGENRERAAFQTLVSSLLGNALIFGAVVLIYYSVDPHTFSLAELAGAKLVGKTFEISGAEILVGPTVFTLLALGIALRLAVWPLHGWLIHTSEEAPASTFVALASLMIPVAGYIFVKICYPLIPETLVMASPYIVGFGIINLLIAAFGALAQRTVRSLLAYIGIAQTGFFLVGIGSLSQAGVVGAIYNQFSLALAIGCLGLLSGKIENQLGTARFCDEEDRSLISGMLAKSPALAVVFAIALASLAAMPGLGGFVGQALILLGSYSIHPLMIILASLALLLSVYALFNMFRDIFLGEATPTSSSMGDLGLMERFYFFPMVGFLFVIGIYPKPFLETIRPTILTLISSIR
jgi:NADH-quinone oxidoreductase subunit M